MTFFATSDSHYEALEKLERNDRNGVTLRRMNELPGQSWPASLGGDPIAKPRGVLVLGDLIDDGDRPGQTEIEWNHFENHFGIDGTDGLLQFPVFEGWGNHDGPPVHAIKHGFSVQQQIRRRNLRRLELGLVSSLAPNQLHSSWDWNGVHFIQTNLYPADRQHPSVRYSLPWHDPQLALQFVRDDLAASVGDSGRPVIIMAHCGFDTDWWVAEDWLAFHTAIAPYNVVAYFHGHSGTGLRRWQPAEGARPLQIVNTGQTEKGFFVAQVSATRLRVAFQAKRDAKALADVTWEWKYLLDLPLARAGETPVAPPKPSPPPQPTPPQPIPPQPTPRPNSRPPASAAPRTTAGVAPRPGDSPDHPHEFRVAVIGDFGYDKALVKPVKPVNPPPTPPTTTTTKPSPAPPPPGPPSSPGPQCPKPGAPQPGSPAPPAPLSATAPPVTGKDQEGQADDSVPEAPLTATAAGRPLPAAQVARLVDSWRPDFVITTGDNNYPKGEAGTIDHNIGRHYAHYIGDYRGLFGPGSEVNRFFPVLGNHDWDAPRVGCQAYLDYFNLPGNERYYDFAHGPIHFFLLDSDGHEPDGNRPGSVQHQWLTRAVASSESAIQVVVLHHPPYSSGSHGGLASSQWNFAELGIDLVLSGHDHNYERLERDGVKFVVNGAGGAALRPFKSAVEGSVVRHHASHGALRLDVQQLADHARLQATFIEISGREIDSFEISRPLASPIPPAAHRPPE